MGELFSKALLALYLALLLAAMAAIAVRSLRVPLPRWSRCTRIAMAAALLCALAAGVPKTNAPMRMLSGAATTAFRALSAPFSGESPFTLAEVRTNGVAIAAQPTNAIVSERLLRRGTSEGGEWIEVAGSPLVLGTNEFSRVYASLGVLSFGTMRHPALGAFLPDGSDAKSLVALRTPLGIAPMQNWHRLAAPSRFWHAPTAAGHLFTWDNALLGRLDGAPVTIQIESRPDGGFSYRYDFSQAAPTNDFTIGYQMGADGAEALSVRGGVTNGATLFQLDGEPAPQGVDVAAVFARSPRFELIWRDTSGLGDLSDDTDGDGLTDYEEVMLHGTDPREADTDGDGIGDGAEISGGTDPLEPDEDRDMVADGTTAAAIAASGYMAQSAECASLSLTFSIAASHSQAGSQPATGGHARGADGVFELGGVPLVVTNGMTLNLSLPPDETLDFRFASARCAAVGVSASGSGLPVVADDARGFFRGAPCHNARGRLMAARTARLSCPGASGPCIHHTPGTRTYTAEFGDGCWDVWKHIAQIVGENCDTESLTLTVADAPPSTANISITFPESAILCGNIAFGASIHRCEAGTGGHEHCARCNASNPADRHTRGLSISPTRAFLGVGTGESAVFSVSGDSYEQSPQWGISPSVEGGPSLVADGGSAVVVAGGRTGVYTVGATAGGCSDTAEVVVYGVDYLTVEPDIEGYAEPIVRFSGMAPHPFDRTRSPVPDLHQPVFFKDVQTNLVAQPFQVDLVAHFTPDSIGDGDVDCEWSLVGDGVGGNLSSAHSTCARFEPTSGGGVYRFSFQCGNLTNSEAVLVLPLSGASVDEIIAADLERAETFVTNVLARYSIKKRSSPFLGIRWFYANNMGDYSGRPDNVSNPTVWPYNQVVSDPGSSQFSLGACGTAFGIPVRMAKFSNFMVGYACERLGVSHFRQNLSRIVAGTIDDSSAAESWSAARQVANGSPILPVLTNLVRHCWTNSGLKAQRIWPNPLPPDNYGHRQMFANPDHQFTSPGFLFEDNP